MPRPEERIVIRKYADRRLDDTVACMYVTLEDLAAMSWNGNDFLVYDAKSSEDITRSILMLITPTTEH
jgi:polyhydroxyalkanoate synthesis repressor PhaR